MSEYRFVYREVIPDQTIPQAWKEINLNTGGSQSTLQDIKVAERANGYCYIDNSRHVTRNRFIYWRLNNDTLELIEESLDVNLSGNRLKYRFCDTPILDGISIHETHSCVVFLIPTVCSVHRLTFTHPNNLYGSDISDSHPDLSLPSIFASCDQMQNSNCYVYVFDPPASTNSLLPHAAASWLTHDEEAVFTFAYPSGELLLVKLQANGAAESVELKYETMVPKFLAGMFKKSSGNYTVSMLLHTIGLETYAITLCHEGQLKIWSCSKAQCIAVSDILISEQGSTLGPLEGQCQLLKKVIGTDENEFLFAAYTRALTSNEFQILKPIITGNQFIIEKVSKIDANKGDLIDFTFTPNFIWSVFRTKYSEWQLYTGQYSSSDSDDFSWQQVALEQLPNPDELFYDECVFDPKQVYLDFIFYPGRFPLQIISKALCIYTRSMIVQDIQLSANVLKEHVTLAVENQIQEKLQDFEMSDSEYIDKAAQCWSAFYSCCVQYHVTGLRPLGILLLPSVSGAILLKKAAYSFLRPVDVLEHLILCPSKKVNYSVYNDFQLTDEEHDLLVISELFDYIQENFPEDLQDDFEKNLSLSLPPKEAIEEALKVTLTDEFLVHFQTVLSRFDDLYITAHKLLELLRMDEIDGDFKCPKHLQTSVAHLFSSNLGTSVIAQSFAQQVQTKFLVCRNLLIMQCAIVENQKQTFSESLRSVVKLEVDIILNAYFAMFWLSKQVATPTLPLETQNQRLSSLKFKPVFNARLKLATMTNLVEMYALSNGSFDAHQAVCNTDVDEDYLAHWHTALLSYLLKFTLLIWPINGNPSFLEWLLCSGQHLHLQSYVNLMEPWCSFYVSSRSFLAAVSFLNTGEVSKAHHLFREVLEDRTVEEYIEKRLQPIAHPSQTQILLNLKVIQMFVLHGASDFAIKVAEEALNKVDDDESLKPTLHSIIFKHHLALGHYEEAFKALCANPATERKKDNLRDLVKTLLDGGHTKLLMAFDYEDLEDLFLCILYTRARAIDSIENIYYDFLFAYAVRKSMWRLSASVMYEQAYRLNQHPSLEGLEKQVKCLLMAVNSLELEDVKYRWVLKPADPEFEEEAVSLPPLAGSNEAPETLKLKRQVECIDLNVIKKELTFSKAKLKLAHVESNTYFFHVQGPSELLMFLSSNSLYKEAFKICQAFDLKADLIFESLVHQCVALDQNEDCLAWKWLLRNDINDFSYVPNAPSKMSWLMLKTYLEQHEEPDLTCYHRVVALKMIQLGQLPPLWLLNSYKRRNPAELLRLYHSSGLLFEASELAKDYLKAAMGHGPEHFGIKISLSPLSKPMSLCLPINALHSLVWELKAQNECNPDRVFEKDYEALKGLLKSYVSNSLRLGLVICNSK